MAEAQVPFTPFPSVQGTGGEISVGSSDDAFGGGIAAASSRLGATIQDAGNTLLKVNLAKAGLTNELYANDASTQLMKQVTGLYGEFSKNEGKSAVEALPAFQQKLDQLYKDSLASMPNLATKAAASRSLRYTTDTYYKYAQSYADTQFKSWQDKSAVDRSDELRTQAVLAINDPEKMNTFMNGSDDEVRKLYEQRGWDQVAIQDQIKDNRGKTVDALVSQLINSGDPKGASLLFNMYDDQIDSASKVLIMGKLRPALTAERASNVVDTVVGRGIIAPNILRAQIHRESGGNDAAVSPVGALGRMQLMPETAKMVAEEMGLPYDKDRLLTDPAYNQALGTHYMEGLLQRFNGNYALALAGYNAGPGRVDKWIKAYGNPGDTPEEQAAWVAKIPIKETREYVQNIFADAGGAPQGAPADGSLPDRATAISDVMQMTEGNPGLRTASLAQLNQEYTVQAAANADQDRQRRLFQEAQTAADTAAQNEVISDSLSPDPKITAVEVANDSRLKPENKTQMINWINAQAKGEPPAATSRVTSSELLRRLYLPEGNPDKLTTLNDVVQARIDMKLTNADFDFVQKQYTQSRSDTGATLTERQGQFFTGVKSLITKANPLLGTLDPSGDYQMYLYQQFVAQKVDEFRTAGKDPNQLFNPASPEYIGKPETIASYQKPLDASMQDIVNRATGSSTTPGLPDVPAANDSTEVHHNSLGDAIQGVKDFLAPVANQELLTSFRGNLISQGYKGEELEKLYSDYQNQLEGKDTPAKIPYTPSKRAPGESPEQYLKRVGPQSALTPDEFGKLDIGSKLSHLERLLG